MRITMDLHTHTRYSRLHHGKGTVEENVRAARKRGIGLAISDHGPGHFFYGVRPKKYSELQDEIARENDRAGYRAALLGIEANVMDWEGRLDVELLPCAPEVLLFGYHKGFRPLDQAGRRFWQEVTFHSGRCEDKMTEAVCWAMERYPVDILTHPGEYVPVDIRQVARTAARLGVVLEINDRHGLSPRQINTALEEGAYFILQSDAHQPERVGDVESALRQAAQAALPESRIVNSGAYNWKGRLRIDRLEGFVENLP